MPYKKIFLIANLICFALPAHAAELCGRALQGEIMLGIAPQATAVKFNQISPYIDQEGLFFIALGRDQKSNSPLKIDNETYNLDIGPTKWNIQNIKGIPPRKVTPPDSDLRSIEFEQKVVRASQQTQASTPFWKKGFIMPVEGRISGEFGGQRIMNGVKKNPHSGMDIAVPAGTPIKASSDGIVVLAQPDLFYSGNVVVLDHGYGIHTIYAHMQKIDVNKGDTVKQGDILGLVGSTGRATGPHLHWGASVNGIKINPPSLLNINNYNDFCFTL